MELADLAFGECHQSDLQEAQALQQRGHVLLVARQPIQRLRDHHVERGRAGVGEEGLVAGSSRAGAAPRGVGVDTDLGPALARDTFSALAKLILDRGCALRVRRVARVHGGAKRRRWRPQMPSPRRWASGPLMVNELRTRA